MALEINEGYKQLDTKTLGQEEKLRQMVEMARQLEASAMQVLDIRGMRTLMKIYALKHWMQNKLMLMNQLKLLELN